MSNYPNPMGRPYEMDYQSKVGAGTISTFFNAVYAWMAAGLATTALVAWWVSTQPELMRKLFSGPALIILFIAEIGLVIAISRAINKISAGVATGMFLLYAALNGLTLSVIFLVHANATIAAAFIITGGTFGAMSLYGFVTKTDLSRLGSILWMALIGLLIAIVVNMFMASSTLDFIISCAGVLIFVGLTAWDTQKLKMIAVQTENDAALAARLSIVGALTLYLDFINLFLFILRLMGNRRE